MYTCIGNHNIESQNYYNLLALVLKLRSELHDYIFFYWSRTDADENETLVSKRYILGFGQGYGSRRRTSIC